MGQPFVNGPVIIFMGPPASGKSTQAKMVAQTLKLPVLSAEEMIAANPKALSTRPGITGIDPRTDPALNSLFEAAIASETYRGGLIVDGYPATKDHIDHLRMLVTGGRLPSPDHSSVRHPGRRIAKAAWQEGWTRQIRAVAQGLSPRDRYVQRVLPRRHCDPRRWNRQTCDGEQARGRRPQAVDSCQGWQLTRSRIQRHIRCGDHP